MTQLSSRQALIIYNTFCSMVNFTRLHAMLYAIYPTLITDVPNNLQLNAAQRHRLGRRWQQLTQHLPKQPSQHSAADEQQLTDWLMALFTQLFTDHNVCLVRGGNDPEYFPASIEQPARIEFANGYFASALHEISHWCIAGKTRRTQIDFGYWYAADGRTQAQQRAFERVEVKPQALECLFTLACQRPFVVSADNLTASYTRCEHFARAVYTQAKHHLQSPHTLPLDAKRLLIALLSCNPVSSLTTNKVC